MIEYETALEVGTRMAQELQEFIDAGEEAGCSMAATQALLDDWEAAYKRACQPRENLPVEFDDEPIVITVE